MQRQRYSEFITVLMVVKYWYSHIVELYVAIKNNVICICSHGHLALIHSGVCVA